VVVSDGIDEGMSYCSIGAGLSHHLFTWPEGDAGRRGILGFTRQMGTTVPLISDCQLGSE
jgi:hypothetical protein